MNRIKRELFLGFTLFLTTVCLISCKEGKEDKLTISASEYRNKMKGAWIGLLLINNDDNKTEVLISGQPHIN